MNLKNLEELRQKLLKIKVKGFIKSHREDNTGIGKTLEDELGIIENNQHEADLKIGNKKAELKGQRKNAKSRVTLSTKEPEWIKDKFVVINKTGYVDKKGRWGLKNTLSNLKENKRGWKLDISKDKIVMINKDLGEACFFDKKILLEIIKEKIGENLVLVLAEVKKRKDKEYFHYTDAVYYEDFNESNFIKLLVEGRIIWEFRLHLNSSTNIRDHGSGFRISRKYLDNLFDKKIVLF
jgi:hypothetical protein